MSFSTMFHRNDCDIDTTPADHAIDIANALDAVYGSTVSKALSRKLKLLETCSDIDLALIGMDRKVAVEQVFRDALKI